MDENIEDLKNEYTRYGMIPCFSPEDLRATLSSLGITGKIVKEIKFTGSNLNYDNLNCHSIKKYNKMLEFNKKWIRSCYAETDWPVLIKFEDGSVLTLYSGADDKDNSVYYVGLNAIDWEKPYDECWDDYIENIESTDFNANVLFGRIIGMRIYGFEVNEKFSASDDSRIENYRICFETPYTPIERIKLDFSDWIGYSYLELLDYRNTILEISELQIPDLFAGHEDWKEKQ